MIDSTGNLVNREEYTPYGESSFGSFARKRYRFTGKERDEESGLNYHGARYYAPWLGRWLSADPLTINYAISSWNVYCYVEGHLLNATDPDGLTTITRELSEIRLEEIAMQYNVGQMYPPGVNREQMYPPGVNRERKIGRWFQNTLLDGLGLREYGYDFPSLERAKETGGARQGLRPDAVSDQRCFINAPPGGTLRTYSRGIRTIMFEIDKSNFLHIGHTIKDSTFYEFKALAEGSVIRLRDSNYQILGLIDAASQQAATNDPKSYTPSTIHYCYYERCYF